MPYKNIVFIKLEKRLLNDHRWFGMSDKAQLLYIKLILGCAETYNKLPSDGLTLRRQLRIGWKKKVFDSAIKEIQDGFPKFKKNGKFYYFEEFDTKTNYIREIPSIAQVLPKVVTDIDIDKEKEKEKEEYIIIPFAMMLTEAQNNSKEFLKVWTDWCSLNEDRKTRIAYHTAKEQLRMLGDLEISESIEILRESIQNNWKGLFKQKKEKSKNGSSNPIDADPINSLKYQ